MAVKCILTGQTPSILDGVTENVQTQIDDKQPKITADGILKGDGNSNISAAVKGTDYDTEIGIVHYEDSFDSVEAAYNKSKRLFCSEYATGEVSTDSAKLYALLNRSQPHISDGKVKIKYTFTCLDKTITLTRTKQNSTATPVDTWAKGSQAFNPRFHASTHKTGGGDAIAPSDIGAQTKITANGVLKGDGSGNISAATATDIPGLDGKQAKVTGAATTITDSNLTADRALISNSSGKVAVSSVTSTELGYLDGVTSNIQTQLNNKLSSAPVASVNNKTGAVTLAKGDVGLGNVDNTSDVNKPISNATQAALDGKQAKITASGLLKGDGAGGVTTAIKGTDYVASPEVFIATYGTTTSAEIEAAYQAGKPIIAIYPGKVFQYHIFQRSSATNHKFSTFALNGKFFTIQCFNDVWSDGQNSGVRPSAHASTHATGGIDPITPADIGAATMDEVNAAIQVAIGNAIGGSY